VAEVENLVSKPGVDRGAQLIKFARKEMIDTFDDNEMVAPRERGDERFDFFNGAVFVVASVHK
jgi:hypothetical protein